MLELQLGLQRPLTALPRRGHIFSLAAGLAAGGIGGFSGNFVADIFQEVDEEVRRERLRQLWNRYANYIIAAMVVLILVVGGWRGYQWWQAKKAAETGAVFESAITLANEGKQAEAEAAFNRVAAQGNDAYRALARLREAAATAQKDGPAAVKLYDTTAADGSTPPVMQDLARVRAGLLLIDTAPLGELQARLEIAAGGDRPFRHTARELLAFAAWKAGNAAAAKQWTDAILADAATPQATRQRIDALLAVSGANAKG
jgi:hypothetical protein